MKILGVELRKPSFNEITASAVLAAGLWMAYVGVVRASGNTTDAVQAGGVLLVMFWACVGTRMGIRVERGLRHLAVNALCGAGLLGIYQGVVSAFM